MDGLPGLIFFGFHGFLLMAGSYGTFPDFYQTFCDISLPLVDSLRSVDGGGLGGLRGTFTGGLGSLPGLIFFDFRIMNFRIFNAPFRTFITPFVTLRSF